MGAAAEMRGNAAIIVGLRADARPAEFDFMDHLNSLKKYPDAGTPFASIKFVSDGQYWWALDQKKGWAGRGYWYPSLREAVRRWNVNITGCANGEWLAAPVTKQEKKRGGLIENFCRMGRTRD